MTSRSIYTAGISGSVLAATAEGSMVHGLMAKGASFIGAELAGFPPGLASLPSLATLGVLACGVLALRMSRH